MDLASFRQEAIIVAGLLPYGLQATLGGPTGFASTNTMPHFLAAS